MGVQDNQRTLSFASVSGKQVEAVFDGGALTSDMGVMLLREVASKTGILSRIVAALGRSRNGRIWAIINSERLQFVARGPRIQGSL